MKQFTEICKAASDAYVQAYGNTMMTFGEKHERSVAAAVAAVAPLLLGEPNKEELALAWNKGTKNGDWNWETIVRAAFANRLASVTAKPDPAVEAVKALWLQHDGNASAEQIVAAVDAARGKQ